MPHNSKNLHGNIKNLKVVKEIRNYCLASHPERHASKGDLHHEINFIKTLEYDIYFV